MEEALDLRDSGKSFWKVNRFLGVGNGNCIYPLIWKGFNNIDTGYTIVINQGLPDVRTYTVGNGIEVSNETKEIVWTFDTAHFAGHLVKRVYNIR